MRTRVLIFIILPLIFSSCGLVPANFWTDYKKDQIQDQKSDQGPWGGSRAIYWKSNGQSKFTPAGMLEFAESNGWTLSSQQDLTENDLERLLSFDRKNLQISLTGLQPEPDTLQVELPLYFNKHLTLYRFNTSWVIFDPGTDNSTTENGFIMISKDLNEMALYHIWGE